METIRFKIFAFFTILFIFLIIIRFAGIMLIPATTFPSISGYNLAPERGPILDRNGRILAIQTQLSSVTAWIPNINDVDKTASLLSHELNLDYEQLLHDMNTRSGFMYIKRKISPTENNKIQDLLNNGKLSGIYLEPEYGRNYPERTLGSHVVGFVGTDNIGLEGIEYTFDALLAEGNQGNHIYLTLDVNMQYFSEKLAKDAYEEHNANSVMIMIMDAKSGHFLSWASYPNFDPNTFNQATKNQTQNRPLIYAFEPGSVFKTFSLAAILDSGGITTETSYHCPGYHEYEFPSGAIVRINCISRHGDVKAEDIMKYSCNVGTAQASDTITNNQLYETLQDFGFGSRTLLPLPGETAGIFRNPRFWSGRSKPTISIGQEISVSAVQMLTAATTLTNQGALLKPHIVSKIVSPEGDIIKENKREVVRQVISPATAQAMIEIMETVTIEGTGRRAHIEGLRMSSKTGTAEIIDRSTGTYSKDGFLASTLAIAPTHDPRVIMYVVIEHPRGPDIYGGRIATPIVKDLFEKIIPYLGLERSTHYIVDHPGVVYLEHPEPLTIEDSLPDLTGLSKRQLLPLISIDGLSVILTGEGWVVEQYPAPGTPLEKGMVVEIWLE